MATKRVFKAKQIVERDEKLMRFIGQSGVANLNQIHKVFWEGRQVRTAQQRLAQLVKAGYLVTDFTDVRQPGEQIYGLTAKGRNEFSKLEQKTLTIGLPNRMEMEQQIEAQDVRITLEQDFGQRGFKLAEWKSERRLRAVQTTQVVKEKIVDAEATFTNKQGQSENIKIEVGGKYFGKMLTEKVKSFSSNTGTLIWATTQAHAGRVLAEIQNQGVTNISIMIV